MFQKVKTGILLLLFAVCYKTAGAQGSVLISNDPGTPDPSAVLDVSSSLRGLLIPRMPTIRRLNIVSPAEGLMVYDTDTRSFWFYSNGAWRESLNNTMTLSPMGPALGDLSGSYPAPTVSKIQNLDVYPGFPFDKQVMKWDALNNRWAGQNDSLFLPYNGLSSDISKLFAITNTSLASTGSAIYAKRGTTASGFSPSFSNAIWGESANGAGIVGSSSAAQGLYGWSNASDGVYGITNGNGSIGVHGKGNGTGSIALFGEIPGSGTAVYGITQTGKAGFFKCASTGNTDTAFTIVQEGTGKGAVISVNPNIITGDALTVTNNGFGRGIYTNSAFGSALKAECLSTNFSGYVSEISNASQYGVALSVTSSNVSNTVAAAGITQQGKGNALTVYAQNTGNNNDAVYVNYGGTAAGLNIMNLNNGKAALFQNNSVSTTSPVVTVSNGGSGRGIESINTIASNNNPAVYASSGGQYGVYATAKITAIYGQATGLTGGIAILGQAGLNNSDGIGVKGASYSNLQDRGAVTGENTGDGVGVYGTGTGTNVIGVKGVSGVTDVNSGAVMGANTNGGNGVVGISSGYGVRGIANPSQFFPGVGVLGVINGAGWAVQGMAGSQGNGVQGITNADFGTGVAGVGGLNGVGVSGSAGTNGTGVLGESYGYGYGVKGFTNSTTLGAVYGENMSSGPGVAGKSTATGNGVEGYGGTNANGVFGKAPNNAHGRAGYFEALYASNGMSALKVYNYGRGEALYIVDTNSTNTLGNSNPAIRLTKAGTNDFLISEDQSGVNKIRFDYNGKGFFNGGTQTGGADMAEAFDVNGDRQAYEPGDVLVISKTADRTVEKSTTAYSSLVAGVFATKPGVLMSEENIETDISDKVPMGVVGVIPTKVCTDGGNIERGDLLVSSSRPGVAMKADPDRVKPGQILGKALENFSGSEAGKIRVLVNVK